VNLRTVLLLAALPACTSILELEDPNAEAPEAGTSQPQDAEIDGTLKPSLDAEPEPDSAPVMPPDVGPVCVDEDGDGYGADCPAGPDCDDANPEVAPGAVERCNHIDDDCDDATDESFVGVGDICFAGIGTCSRPGMLTCTEAGDGLFCDAALGDVTPEICNALDDDCDGDADEGVAACCRPGEIRPCGIDRGRCTTGEQQCDGEQRWGTCSGIQPGPEVCNGVDDDCNALIDEGTTNACGQCGDAPDEICNHLDDDCDGHIDEGVANACGQCGALPPETCNAIDDDCDNRVDEGVTNTCGDCGPAPRERCNGEDDDCDNRVDEGVSNACGTCGPLNELCNQADDDCDGTIDEGTCAPDVDACASAPPLILGQVVEGPIGGAPANHAGTCGGRGPERGHLFVAGLPTFTVCASTEGSDFDTVLYVRNLSCADGAQLGCNDDALGTLQSRVQFTGGVLPQFIFVDSFSSNLISGSYRLQVTPGPCPDP
jgi:hypothetical protein